MLNKYYFVIWLQNRQTVDIYIEASSKFQAKKDLAEVYKDARLILNYRIE